MKNTIIAVLVIVVAGTSGVFLYKKFARVQVPNTNISTSVTAVSGDEKSQTSKSITDDGVVYGFEGGGGINAIALDALGNIYAAHSGRVISKTTLSGTVTTFATVDSSPTALAFDTAGNLYVALGSHEFKKSVISKVTPRGVVTTFAEINNYPNAIAFDTAGNLYVATGAPAEGQQDSIPPDDIVNRITPSGVVTIFATVGVAPVALAFDPAGNLYSADHDSHTVSKITTSGVVTTVDFGGDRDLSYPYALVSDMAGNLYVAGWEGIGKITPSGDVTTVAGSIRARSLALDTGGNLYVGTAHGINKITPSGTNTTVAEGIGSKLLAFDTAGNLYVINDDTKPSTGSKITPQGAVAAFNVNTGVFPDSVDFYEEKNLYAVHATGSIVKLRSSGGFEAGTNLSTGVLGRGSRASVGLVPAVTKFATVDGNPATFTSFIFDSSGNLYTANYGSGSISKITPQGTVTTFASVGTQPYSLAFDSSGNLYSANSNGTISKITPQGTVTIFATVDTLGDRLFVYDLAFDTAGNLYTANNNETISKVTPQGTVTTFASVKGTPHSLLFDSSGNLYSANYDAVTAHGSGTVNKINPQGVITLLEKTENTVPTALALDALGNLYVANYGGNYRSSVSKITPQGSVTTYAYLDNNPRALAFDSTGNLYTADNEKTISKITLSGDTVATYANLGAIPNALAFDASGNLYTANSAVNTISKITQNTSGTFTSAIINTEAKSSFTTLEYATTLNGQTITMDARAGNTAVPDSSWTAWQKNVTNGGDISALSGNQYFQYRANFSTTDKNITPTLDSVTVNFTNAIPN